MINLPPVCPLIPTRDESSEGVVVCELQVLDVLMTRSVAVGVQGEEQRGKNIALRGTSADAWDSEMCSPSLTCCLLSDRKSVIHGMEC